MWTTQRACKLKQSSHCHYSLWLWIMTEPMEDNCAIQEPSSCRSATSKALVPGISFNGNVPWWHKHKQKFLFFCNTLKWPDPTVFRFGFVIDNTAMCEPLTHSPTLVNQIKCFRLHILSISFESEQKLECIRRFPLKLNNSQLMWSFHFPPERKHLPVDDY